MYQFTTHFPLAESKSYLDYPEQLLPILEEAILMANAVRRMHKLPPVTNDQIHDGCRMLKLEIVKNNRVRRALGPERHLTSARLDKILTEEKESQDKQLLKKKRRKHILVDSPAIEK